MRKISLILIAVGIASCAADVGSEEGVAARFVGLHADNDGCPGIAGCPKAVEGPVALVAPGTHKDPWPTPPNAAPESPAGLLYCARYDDAPYCAVWRLAPDPYERVRLEIDTGAYYAGLAKAEIPGGLGPEYQDPHAAAVQLSDSLILLNHAATLLPAP